MLLSSFTMAEKGEKQYIIALNTCPNAETAEKIAYSLVESQLAACTNIIPTVQSIYRWQGKIEQEHEALLIIKTRKNKFTQLESLIREHHPYELPEIVAVPIEAGTKEYLNWIDQSLEIKQ